MQRLFTCVLSMVAASVVAGCESPASTDAGATRDATRPLADAGPRQPLEFCCPTTSPPSRRPPNTGSSGRCSRAVRSTRSGARSSRRRLTVPRAANQPRAANLVPVAVAIAPRSSPSHPRCRAANLVPVALDSATVCVPNGAIEDGDYELVVTAPGYDPVETSLSVRTNQPPAFSCDCRRPIGGAVVELGDGEPVPEPDAGTEPDAGAEEDAG